jgi:PTS system nitrogen regulatory IIA component
MSERDFDIERLADFLHLIPQQVNRMADRGQLPGRRISGEWRFSPAEIHHWLEERIGASGEEELIEVEDVLWRDQQNATSQLDSLARLLSPESIAIPLQARTRNSVIQSMVDLAAQTGSLWDPGKMVEAVRARESLHPTALDNGVALLHPRRPLRSILAEPILALGCTHQGIPFGGSRGTLTDVFFLICSVDDRGHLQLLARLSRLVGDADFVAGLRSVDNARAAYEYIQEAEGRLTC